MSRECKAAHTSELARYRAELRHAMEGFAAERCKLVERLRDEGSTVHELTKRCDLLEQRLRARDTPPSALGPLAADAMRNSRNAVLHLVDLRQRPNVVTPPDRNFQSARERAAFSDLLDSNAAFMRQLDLGAGPASSSNRQPNGNARAARAH